MIRPAVAADVPALQRIAHEAYAIYLPRMDRPPSPMLADYAAAVANGEVHALEQAGAVVGLIVLQARDDHLFIENLAVAPAGQSRGSGRALIAFAEREARRRGLSQLRLYTNEVMVESFAFYRRLSFIETGRALEEGYRRVFLVKPL